MKPIKTLIQLCISLAIFFSCEEREMDEKPAMDNNTVNARLATDYKFDGTEGDAIELERARAWTTNFRKQHSEGNVAHFFGYEIVKQLLAEEGCVGIRIYYAIDGNGDRQLVLVGVNSKGENLLPAIGGRINGDENIVADASVPCPTYCPGTSGTSL